MVHRRVPCLRLPQAFRGVDGLVKDCMFLFPLDGMQHDRPNIRAESFIGDPCVNRQAMGTAIHLTRKHMRNYSQQE